MVPVVIFVTLLFFFPLFFVPVPPFPLLSSYITIPASSSSSSPFVLTPFPFGSLHPSLLQSLLELVFGVKVVITGDGFIPGERSVIIMNHRTRLDWMFLWCCLLRYSYLRLEKICLKAALKAVPGFGGYAGGVLPGPTHTHAHLHRVKFCLLPAVALPLYC